jgi:hypothetical protein
MGAPAAAPGLPGTGRPARVPGQGRPAGVLAQILGRDDEDDDRPLPDLPPLPADPRWRIEHLPMISAIGVALALCATSAGFLFGGAAIGLGLGAGVLLVAIGYSLSTLAIGWADTLRPALVLPVGMTVYMVKYILIALILIAAGASGWAGAKPMAFGIAIGAVVMTAAQAFWIARRANRRAAGTT